MNPPARQMRTGQDGKPEFRFPTNRRQRRNGANWRPLSRDAIRIRLAIRNFFERLELTNRTGSCARGAGGTRGYALPFASQAQLVKLLSFSVATKESAATGATAACSIGTMARSNATCS